MEHIAGKTLDLNAIGVCNIALDRPVAFAPYAENHDLGGFILIDRMTNTTVGVGIIHYALRRSQNIHWQAVDISCVAHAKHKNQKQKLLWLTSLSYSGKWTNANQVKKKLRTFGRDRSLLHNAQLPTA